MVAIGYPGAMTSHDPLASADVDREDGDGTASDPKQQAEHPPPPAEPGGGAPEDPEDEGGAADSEE
jgi:hypothetical protein